MNLGCGLIIGIPPFSPISAATVSKQQTGIPTRSLICRKIRSSVALAPSRYWLVPASDEPGAKHTSGSVSLQRSEEHTSELQSRLHLVCRLLLEKKKKRNLHY